MHDQEQEAAVAAAARAEFERIVVAGDAAVASFAVDANRRMIVSLGRAHGDWEALKSTVPGRDHEATQSRCAERASRRPPDDHRRRRRPDGASRASVAL